MLSINALGRLTFKATLPNIRIANSEDVPRSWSGSVFLEWSNPCIQCFTIGRYWNILMHCFKQLQRCCLINCKCYLQLAELVELCEKYGPMMFANTYYGKCLLTATVGNVCLQLLWECGGGCTEYLMACNQWEASQASAPPT